MSELLIVDLLMGLVAMAVLFVFSKAADTMKIEQKEIAFGWTFAHLFRFGHALNIFVVLYYSIRHLIEAYQKGHDE